MPQTTSRLQQVWTLRTHVIKDVRHQDVNLGVGVAPDRGTRQQHDVCTGQCRVRVVHWALEARKDDADDSLGCVVGVSGAVLTASFQVIDTKVRGLCVETRGQVIPPVLLRVVNGYVTTSEHWCWWNTSLSSTRVGDDGWTGT